MNKPQKLLLLEGVVGHSRYDRIDTVMVKKVLFRLLAHMSNRYRKLPDLAAHSVLFRR